MADHGASSGFGPVLGADAVGNVERRLQALTDELGAGRAVGDDTALD